MKTQHSEKRNSFWESKYRWLLAKAALMLLILMGTSAWAQDFVVEGAGSTDANGTYVEYSTLDGVPAYRKEGGAQTWYLYRCWGEYWFIEPYTSCEGMNYYFFNFSDTPPETGWSGWPEPAPTVAPAGRSLAYASTVFNESAANDGAIENSLIITYNEFDGDALTGDLHDDFVALNKVAVANVPIGLTPQLIKTDANELTFSLTGNALNHEQSDSVFNITLEFLDAAFVGGDASGVSNYQLSNISLLNVVTFSGGSGTAIDPFLIGNKLDLQILTENWGDENLWAKHYKQMANITFVAADFEAGGAFYNGGAGWTPIGSFSTPFSGSYNGDGHTIANLFINRDEGEQGFFGRLADGSEITNVGLIDIDFTVGSNSGGLVGFAEAGSSIRYFST
ncbi:MAG: hypothetical protein LAT65_21355 [Saccharospirillum sp.]|nr:hypothetical protein [Saccharospirillum sp.]